MPRRIPFHIVDSFTETPFQGNPAGVFFDDEGSLTPDEMMRLCAEVSLESAFVAPGDDTCRYRLRYFTGTSPIPFCGHATVAALSILADQGKASGDVTLGTDVGRLTTTVAPNASGRTFVTLHQNPVQLGPDIDRAEVASALGLSPDDIRPDLPVQIASTGTPEIFVPLVSRAAVNAISAIAQANAITQLTRTHDTLGIYAFAPETNMDNTPACWSRGFCPLVGLNEDPVTGSASGALGGYLVRHGITGPEVEITNRQGFGGGRGGTAFITVAERTGKLYPSVRGTATIVAQGSFVL